jgi:5'-nucleotidase
MSGFLGDGARPHRESLCGGGRGAGAGHPHAQTADPRCEQSIAWPSDPRIGDDSLSLEENLMAVVPSLFRRRRHAAIALLTALALLLPAGAIDAAGKPTTKIQFLNVSDWHGQLDPLNGIGGAAVLSSYFKADREKNPNTITLTAGDDFGATPPLAGFFEERPAVIAERLLGIQIGTFGNHNFDRGVDHLQQMIDLAGSTDSTVPGAPFAYVAANLQNRDAELHGVADYRIFQFKGVKVAIIGAVNEEAPGLVFPGSFGSMTPTDAVAAVNRARDAARAEDAKIFIVITHKGVTGFNADGSPKGELIDFANALHGFHIVFGDHTDVQWQGRINGALVTENRSKGLTYSRTSLTVEQGNSRVVSLSSEFISPVPSGVTPDQAIVDFLQPYRVELAIAFDQKIGVAADLFPRGGNIERSGEVAIGDLVADAIRLRYGTQIALVNGGGIRKPLPSDYVPLDLSLDRTAPAPYDLVIGDPFAVLPFGNAVVTRSITGAQLWAALENGVSKIDPVTGLGADGRFPQISGFRFKFDGSKAPGSRVTEVALDDGTPILNDSSTYTFAAPDFINTGGDGYTMFLDGLATTRDLMAEVLLDYIQELGTITPTVDGRIDNIALP